MCLSVREDIAGTTDAISIKFFVHVAYDRGSVKKSERDGAFFGVLTMTTIQ